MPDIASVVAAIATPAAAVGGQIIKAGASHRLRSRIRANLELAEILDKQPDTQAAARRLREAVAAQTRRLAELEEERANRKGDVYTGLLQLTWMIIFAAIAWWIIRSIDPWWSWLVAAPFAFLALAAFLTALRTMLGINRSNSGGKSSSAKTHRSRAGR